MSFRVKASAIALTAAACMLLAPTAMASSGGPVQVTGKQLKSALLPGSDFVSGYGVLIENDSGGKLEHGALFNLHSMNCPAFWPAMGLEEGFGETAFADDTIGYKSGTPSVDETFTQSVYQFASTRAASSFFAELKAKYRSCPSASVSAGKGPSARWVVRSESGQHVGGHQALKLADEFSSSEISGGPIPIDVLWTIDGTDIYMINTTLQPGASPKPTQSSLTLELIAHVSALR